MTSEQGQSGPASQPVSCLVLFTIQQAAVSPYLSPSPGQARDNCTAGQDFVKTVVLSGQIGQTPSGWWNNNNHQPPAGPGWEHQDQDTATPRTDQLLTNNLTIEL